MYKSELGGQGESLISEYQSEGRETVLLDEPNTPLVADFSRDGVDLVLEWPSGEQVIVRDYFSTSNPPDLKTPGGAFLDSDLVVKLSGPGPYAQSQNSVNDESPIGELETLSGEVSVQHSNGSKDTLVEGAAVFKGDILSTGDDGSFKLVFSDETELTMGENGRVVLDDLVYSSSSSSSSFGISLLQGVFSVVSGLIGKENPEAVSIKTPVGTIGIRGTSWLGKILALGEETLFTLFTGSIIIANEAGSQILSVANQSVIVTSYSLPPSLPFILSKDQMLDIYGRALGHLDPDYQEDDDDFDPDAIAPEAGGRADGGGASFQAFAALQAELAQGLDALLDSGVLLGGTEFSVSDFFAPPSETVFEDTDLPEAVVDIATVSASGTSSTEGFSLSVLLDSPATVPTVIYYSVVPVGGSGDASDDLNVMGDGQIVIPAGETKGSVLISVIDDNVIENTKFYRIELTGAENAVISPFFNEALLVLEDDDVGVISLQAVTGSEVAAPVVTALAAAASDQNDNSITISEDEGVVSFKLVLDKALDPGVELSVDYVVSGGGDGVPSALTQTVTFSGGTEGLPSGSEVVVEIPISNDDIWLGTRSFSISLQNPSEKASIDPQSPALAVTIIDDEIPPTAVDDQINVSEVLPTHAVFVVDTSGSMGASGLQLVEDALTELTSDLYASNPMARITLIDFDIASNVIGTFNSQAEALAGLEVLSTLSGGWTNYQAALETAQTVSFEGGYQKAIYFISDGIPTHGETAQAIAEFNEWVTDDLGGADVYSVAIGVGTGNTYLGQIDTTSSDNTEPANYLVVGDASDLEGSLNFRTFVDGNVLSNDKAGDAAFQSQPIQSIVYDSVLYDLSSTDPGVSVDGDELSLETAFGLFTINFVSGDYNFSSDFGVVESREETISYTIVDDTNLVSTADLTIQIGSTSALSSVSLSAVQTPIVGTVEDDTLFGSEQAEGIFGYAGNDELYGKQGNDTLSGGAGNDIFHYENISDAEDIISDFNMIEDQVNLDDLFDGLNLILDGSEIRAGMVVISGDGENQELTLDGYTDFKITFERFSEFSLGDAGDFTEDNLTAMNITVDQS